MSNSENKTEWKPTLQEGWEKLGLSELEMPNGFDNSIVHFEDTAERIIVGVSSIDTLFVSLDKTIGGCQYAWLFSIEERLTKLRRCEGESVRTADCRQPAYMNQITSALQAYYQQTTLWEPSLQDGWQDVDVAGVIMWGRPISGIVHFEETDEYIIAGFDEEDPLYFKLDKATGIAHWSWVGDAKNGEHFHRYNTVKNETELDNLLTYGQRSDYIEGKIFKILLDYLNKKKGQNMENNTGSKISGLENLKMPEGIYLLDFKRDGDAVTVKVRGKDFLEGFVKYDYTNDKEYYDWGSFNTEPSFQEERDVRANNTNSGAIAQAIKDMIDAEVKEDPADEIQDTQGTEEPQTGWNSNLSEVPEYEPVLITGMAYCNLQEVYVRFSVVGQRKGSDFIPLHRDTFTALDSTGQIIPTFAEDVKWCLIENPVPE